MSEVKAVHGTTNPDPAQFDAMTAKPYGSVFELNPDGEQLYRDLHANAWDTVVDRLRKSNITNFSIFITKLAGRKYVVSYFEYVGTDFDADQAAMADDPETQRWWKALAPCEVAPSEDASPDSENMDLVFHID